MMLRVLQGLGVISVAAVAGQEQHAHPILSTADQSAAAADWRPRFFNAGQNETMVAMSEQIIPGSREAFCNRLIDSVLPIESEKNRAELLGALSAFDTESKRLYGKTFQDATLQEQAEILSVAAQPDGKLYSDFTLAKEWTADAYWSSSKGLHELGWTGRVAWESFPDCHDAVSNEARN